MYSIFKNSLIVSCQAEDNEPLYGAHHMERMAIAAVQSGAKGIRANSAIDVEAIKRVVDVPVIGLIKDRNPQYKAFITTTFEQIRDLVNAGADLIAIDSTGVSRPVPVQHLYAYIKKYYPTVGIVADVADIGDVKKIVKYEPDFISTTLSGYTDYTQQRKKPDLDFIDEIRAITTIPVIAEGNYKKPHQVRQAILRGAYTVVVGGAITRPQQITENFTEVLADLKEEVLSIGIDIGATQLRSVLTNRFGNVLDSIIQKTPGNADGIVQTVIENIERLTSVSKPISSVGIATAGRCDEKNGMVRYATDNIKDWSGRAIGNEIYEATGFFPVVNNDANLAAYGQWKKSRESSLALLTIGTGIGAGIIVDGKLIDGAYGGGAEVGHIIFPGNNARCTCSKKGCIETIASAKVLREKIIENPENEKEIMADFISKIAWLIDTIQRTVEVEAIYLSGAINKYQNGFLERLNNELRQIDDRYLDQFIRFSVLGELAGAIGASLYALDRSYKHKQNSEVIRENQYDV